MRQLVCLPTWPGEADALRVRFKFSSIAFSQRVGTQSRSILFLSLTFPIEHEKGSPQLDSKVEKSFAVSCQKPTRKWE